MSKSLLIDTVSSGRPVDILSEAKIVNGVMFVSGVLQRANVPNQNNRIYPFEILKREVDKYQDKIRTRGSHGELDHPNVAEVRLSNTSHIITETWWEGDTLMGICEVLSTPAGKTLRALVENNVSVGISSRGAGSVSKPDKEGKVIVQEDFDLLCWDFVSNPSTHGAWMNLKESKSGLVIPTKEGILSQIISLGY